jgi:hypothetical protein
VAVDLGGTSVDIVEKVLHAIELSKSSIRRSDLTPADAVLTSAAKADARMPCGLTCPFEAAPIGAVRSHKEG